MSFKKRGAAGGGRRSWDAASGPQIWDGTVGVVGKSGGSWVSLGTARGWTKSDTIIELWEITDWSTFGSVSEVRLENKVSNTLSPAEAARAVEEKTDGSGNNRFSVWVIEDKSVTASSLTLLDPGSTWSKEIWDVYQADPASASPVGRVYRSAKTTNGERATLDQWFYSSSYTGVIGTTQQVWLKKNETAAYTQTGLNDFRDSVQSTGTWKVHAPGYHFRRYT
jgi:hypothetical protein